MKLIIDGIEDTPFHDGRGVFRYFVTKLYKKDGDATLERIPVTVDYYDDEEKAKLRAEFDQCSKDNHVDNFFDEPWP